MDDLHLIGVHEDGDFLLLGGPDGARYRLAIDDSVRAAIRWERPGAALRAAGAEPLRPRDVQAMIRAGATAEEAAERAGWTVEKVHRYEGPILAERDHVAQLAGSAVLRSRTGVSFTAPTLRERVLERLAARQVDADAVSWDSWRSEDGEWTVELHFEAGGVRRTASWRFSRAAMSVLAVDDEARWLSEEDHPTDSPAVRHVVTSGRAQVYDIEAEGGVRASRDRAADEEGSQPAGDGPAEHGPAGHGRAGHEPAEPDLMTAVRQRSGVQTRRRRGSRRAGPAALPGDVAEVVPLEHIDYDPETMPPPPSAHASPEEDGLDGQPEPEAAAYEAAGAPITEEGPPVDHPQPVDDPQPVDNPQQAAASPRTRGQRSQPTGRQRAKARPRKARPGVPAWDDIVFGGGTPPAE